MMWMRRRRTDPDHPRWRYPMGVDPREPFAVYRLGVRTAEVCIGAEAIAQKEAELADAPKTVRDRLGRFMKSEPARSFVTPLSQQIAEMKARRDEVDAAVREGLRRYDYLSFPMGITYWAKVFNETGFASYLLRQQILDAWREQHAPHLPRVDGDD